MSDPRFTDPRLDPRLDDPVVHSDERTGGMWGWIAGLVVLALIAFVVVAGWNGGPNVANAPDATPPASMAATPAARSPLSPPSTTGSGTMSPQPVAPPASGNNQAR